MEDRPSRRMRTLVTQLAPSCLIPGFYGASLSTESKDALWARFFMGAPRRQRRLDNYATHNDNVHSVFKRKCTPADLKAALDSTANILRDNFASDSAGLTHGGFYRHFGSKDQLISEASADAFAANIGEMEASASTAKGRKALEASPMPIFPPSTGRTGLTDVL